MLIQILETAWNKKKKEYGVVGRQHSAVAKTGERSLLVV